MDTGGKSVLSLHYRDDLLLVEAADSEGCEQSLDQAMTCCKELGLPISHKHEGPTSVLTFLDIEFDVTKSMLRLPQDKLQRLERAITWWEGRESCTK